MNSARVVATPARNPGRSPLAWLLATACWWVTAAAATEQPGDSLPASEDNATYRDCPSAPLTGDGPAPRVSPSGSQIVRVLSAGPRREDGSLAFVSGICVYLPPGYDDGTKRYPVIYNFHGDSGYQSLAFTDQLDAAYAKDPDNAVIMVGPDGSGLATWFDRLDNFNINPQTLIASPDDQGIGYRRTLNETYVLKWVIPFIDQHFRTIPTREGRATHGISNGGMGTTLFPAKAPDLFATASTMSGNVAWQSFALGSEMFLDPASGEVSLAYRAGNLAENLAGNLDRVDMIFDIGTGCPDPSWPIPIGGIGPACTDVSWVFEQLFVPGNRDLQKALAAAQHVGLNDYREPVGGHDFKFWSQWFAERHLPFLLTHLADPQPMAAPVTTAPPPRSFRYRSISPKFSIYGYEVSVTRAVREFVDLAVSEDAITLRGSGQASITTPPIYQPGQNYQIRGTSDDPAEKTESTDDQGRLHIAVDLGPSNLVEHDGVGSATAFANIPLVDSTLDSVALSVVRSVSISGPPAVADTPAAAVSPPGGSGGAMGLFASLCLAVAGLCRRWRYPGHRATTSHGASS